MSVRPVLEEGSRFSLKRAFIGEERVFTASTPIVAPKVQQQQQPVNLTSSLRALSFTPAAIEIDTAAVPKQALSFKFNIATPQVAPVPSIPSTQKAKGLTFSSFGGSGGPASTSFASSTKMKKSFDDSKNDVLRLSAIVDTMNSKLSAITEKLQNTEASLAKANAAFVAERSRSRDLKARLAVDKSASEAEISKLRDHVNTKMTIPKTSNTDAAFKTLAKVKEQLESKHDELDSMHACMAAVSHERDTATVAIESITSEHRAMADAMATAVQERDDAVLLLEAATTAAATAEAASEALASTAVASEAAAALHLHESEKCSFEAKLSELTLECASLREQIILGSPATDTTLTLQPDRPTETPTNNIDLVLDAPTGCGDYHGFGVHPELEYTSDDDDEEVPRIGTSHGPSVFVEKKTTDSNKYGSAVLVSASLRCPRSVRIATLHSDTFFTSQMATGDSSANAVDEKVQKLIAAVSADIIKSAMGSRSEYLLASGMASDAVEKELEALRGDDGGKT